MTWSKKVQWSRSVLAFQNEKCVVHNRNDEKRIFMDSDNLRSAYYLVSIKHDFRFIIFYWTY